MVCHLLLLAGTSECTWQMQLRSKAVVRRSCLCCSALLLLLAAVLVVHQRCTSSLTLSAQEGCCWQQLNCVRVINWQLLSKTLSLQWQLHAAAAAVRQPRVSLSDAGHSLLVHCSSGGFVELAVDLRTGRSVAALSGALADDSLYRAFSSSSSSSSRAVLTQLQEAVDLPAGEQGRQHAQGRAQLARCVSAALRAGTVAHIEVQARCALGLEPHQRWQQLLVRPAGSGDTAAAAAATQQHSTSTYIPVATAQELGPVSSSSGVQWVPLAATDSVSGQYTSLLQVSARADGSASVCLHITSEGSTGLRPRIVGTKQYGSVATSVSSSSSSSMGVFDACPQRSDAAALRVSSRYAAESVLEPSDSSALVNAVADACRRLA
jgi:hypothetical protein